MSFASQSASAQTVGRLFPFGFYPKPTGDPGQDRHARTLQYACLLLAILVGTVAAWDVVAHETSALPVLGMAMTGLVAALIINRQGLWKWGGWMAFIALLVTGVLLVVEARDGFRSLAMLLFPALLLISVMLLDRMFYIATACTILITVTALGIADMHGLTQAVPGVRSPTSYQSIFTVDLIMLVFAAIGSRFARDVQTNVSDLRTLISRLSVTNLELTESAKALRESELKYRRLYESITEAVVTVDTARRITETNPAYESMLGYTGEELRRMYCHDLTPERWHDFENRIIEEQILKNGVSEAYEKEYRRRDGTVFPAEVRAFLLRDENGQPIGMWAMVRDITERKQAEAALRQSERHLKNAERIAHIGHWQWDLQSDRVSGSEEMYRIFGKTADYVPSYNGFLDDLASADRERMQELIKDSLTSKAGHSMEYQVRTNGDLRTISCIWEVLLDEEGAPVRIFGTCQDITESRHAQEEFFSKQKLEIVGTLASGIAHDFNNLLGGVLGQAELALYDLQAGSSPEEELKAIRDVAIRGAEIVRELMIYAGKESDVRELVDLSQIVKEMLELLKISVSKHATLVTDFGKDLPAVRANAAQLRQIVMNLVTNASEALEERDGVIRVSTSYVKVDQDSPAAASDGLAADDYLQLEVSDTGCGMSDETRARVFDPFFTTKSAGHGLGLAVVGGIVRGLGGAIHVTSEVGKGSTFQILLPSSKTVKDEISSGVPDGELPLSSQHAAILIVEDEDVLREAVTKTLRKTGFEVFEVTNGTSAIDLLRAKSGKLDLLLLDMTIPGASSQEVVAEAVRVHPETRVVLTSAYSEDIITRTVDPRQFVSFIRKPFRIGDLVQIIQNALSEQV